MNSKKVIAIDFGTTNTYVSIGSTEDQKVQLAQIHDQVKGIASALLYTNRGKSPLIGDIALNEYAGSFEEDRVAGDYHFFTHFKPDIQTSETARKCSVDFLKSILRDAAQKNILLNASESQVIIGVPSEASADYQSCLKAIAKEAGWGDVSLIHEPIGALYDKLSDSTIPVSTIQAGLLVIDFGGGTCDFAYLKNGRIVHSWGEMLLGGRLFDDLFYQWFLDLNPGKEQELEASGEAYYVRMVDCREMKEKFSEFMRSDPEGSFRHKVGSHGAVRGLRWEEFLKRSKNYKPSESFARQCDEAHIDLPNHIRTDGVDLIEWFNRSLVEGLREKNICTNDIHVVVLAGGSSLWPFVKDCCVQKLNLAPEIVSQSLNPYATISEGLAVYPAIQAKIHETMQGIHEGRSEFIETIKQNDLNDCVGQCIEEILGQIDTVFFVEAIKPILLKYREQGGTIKELKEEIAAAAQSYQPILEGIVNSVFSENIPALYETALNKTRDWLNQKGIRLPESDSRVQYAPNEISLNAIDTAIADAVSGNVICVVTAIIGGVIIASICGGGGMALLVSGPIGWILGLILGGVAVLGGAEVFRPMMEGKRLSPFIFGRFLTDNKIEECEQKFIQDLTGKMEEEREHIGEVIGQQLSAVIDKEIDGFKELDVKL